MQQNKISKLLKDLTVFRVCHKNWTEVTDL